MFANDSWYRKKRDFSSMLLPLLLVCFSIANVWTNPGILIAEDLDSMRLNPPQGYMSMISDEELAGKVLLDTGWRHVDDDFPGLDCAHILINLNPSLLCVPVEVRQDFLMLPLSYFRFLAGCGLETGLDGRIRLVKYDRTYVVDPDSSTLSDGVHTWQFPIQPYEAHGLLFVPFRFFCEILELDIQWHDKNDIVLLHSPWVDAGSLAASISALNARLLDALRFAQAPEEEAPVYGDPIEMTVTFYYSSSDPTYTASGSRAESGSIAAGSAFPFGARLYIPELQYIREDGVFTVHDRGTAITGNKIDVFLPNTIRGRAEVEAALRTGRLTVTAYPIAAETD